MTHNNKKVVIKMKKITLFCLVSSCFLPLLGFANVNMVVGEDVNTNDVLMSSQGSVAQNGQKVPEGNSAWQGPLGDVIYYLKNHSDETVELVDAGETCFRSHFEPGHPDFKAEGEMYTVKVNGKALSDNQEVCAITQNAWPRIVVSFDQSGDGEPVHAEIGTAQYGDEQAVATDIPYDPPLHVTF